MINACNDQYKDTEKDGCKFHSKQAWERKMKEIGIPQDEIDMAMQHNCLDILTIIPKDEIKSKGIPYVKNAIESIGLSADDKEKWLKFWKYFNKFWMSSDEFIMLWNHHGIADSKDVTNNGLER